MSDSALNTDGYFQPSLIFASRVSSWASGTTLAHNSTIVAALVNTVEGFIVQSPEPWTIKLFKPVNVANCNTLERSPLSFTYTLV